MKPPAFFRFSLPLALLAMATAASASPASADPMLDAAVLALLERGVLSAEAGQPAVLERPAEWRRELGAVIDGQPEDGGLPRVLAITPGGAAERMQLQVGDRLLSANGQPLTTAHPGPLLRAAVAGDSLELEVQRGEQRLALRGLLDQIMVPAYRLEVAAVDPAQSTCARISVFDNAPRQQRLFQAVLIALDGRLPGPPGSSWRITPGRHELTVAEAIDSREFVPLHNATRDRLPSKLRYKTLILDAQPGITYRLAAKLNVEQRDSIRDGGYWEPVIWKQSAEPCR